MYVTDIHKHFGLALRDARLTSGLSQEGLAERAGIHRTYVSSVELGKVHVGLDVAQRLATALGLKLSDLISVAEEIGTSPGGQ